MLGIFKCNPEAIIPSYATEKSSCFDLHACLTEATPVQIKLRSKNSNAALTSDNEISDVIIINSSKQLIVPSNSRVLVPTGIKFKISPNCSVRLHPRSGLSFKHGIMLANCEGVIDEDYHGEIFVALFNCSNSSFTINHGDRICQAEVVRDERYAISEIYMEPQKTSSRDGGFGSTGK